MFRRCSHAKETKAQVKFPENATVIEIEWLNKYFFNFTVSGDNLLFKVRKYIDY